MTTELHEYRLLEVTWIGRVPTRIEGVEPIRFVAADEAEARRVLVFAGRLTGRRFQLGRGVLE